MWQSVHPVSTGSLNSPRFIYACGSIEYCRIFPRGLRLQFRLWWEDTLPGFQSEAFHPDCTGISGRSVLSEQPFLSGVYWLRFLNNWHIRLKCHDEIYLRCILTQRCSMSVAGQNLFFSKKCQGNRRLRGCKPEVTWLFDGNSRKPLDSVVYML